ncbi:MAG: dimethyl sulfoxide reductase anchor subunit [Eggerthellaceae bacterium]|nr:dimethyl sulfoxide reductase anchor subunit [Eggerthellaceae bacterium]
MEAQWSLVLFTVLSGAGAWLFASSMIQALAKKGALPGRVETIVSAVLLAAGGLASMTHLKHIDRIFEALNHPTSGIFVEAAMIGVLIVLMVVYFALLVRGSGKGALRAVGAAGAIVGIVFAFACGYSYLMEARQAWMTVALPLAYCATAGAAGAGLNLLLKAVGKGGDAAAGADAEAASAAPAAEAADGERAGAVSFAGLLAAVLAVVALLCCAAFLIYAAPWVAEAKDGFVIWAVVTFAAVLVAAGAGAWAWKKPEAAGAAAGGVAAAAGIVCAVALRVAMWLVGTSLMDLFLMPLD